MQARLRLTKALAWIDDNFDLFLNRNVVFKGGAIDNLKHASELALVGSLLTDCNVERGWCSTALQSLWIHVFEEGDLFRKVLLVRPDMIAVLSTYANFHQCGFTNKSVQLLAEALSKSLFFHRLPMPYWRYLDVMNSLARIGILQFPSNAETLSYIGCLPPLSVISTDVAYAATHEIFYLSDFGRSRNRVSADLLDYLNIGLPIWQRHFVKGSDVDLTAEFLLCSQYLSLPFRSQALAFCLKSQKTNGSFPGPQRVSVVSSDNDRLGAFRSDYHTTLVMCALLAKLESKPTYQVLER